MSEYQTMPVTNSKYVRIKPTAVNHSLICPSQRDIFGLKSVSAPPHLGFISPQSEYSSKVMAAALVLTLQNSSTNTTFGIALSIIIVLLIVIAAHFMHRLQRSHNLPTDLRHLQSPQQEKTTRYRTLEKSPILNTIEKPVVFFYIYFF